jgi:uncharacterized protein (TIGR02246 family)
MRVSVFTPFLIIGISFATITQAADQDASAASTALCDTWNATMKQKDAAAHADLYTEDAVQITPHGLISGKTAIKVTTEQALKDYKFNPSTVYNSVILNGIMLRTGQWSATSADGKTAIKGYWSDVDVQVHGKWKIKRETFNFTPTS